jgi:hypothetical protein
LNGIVTVYGKNMTGIELVKMAVQNAFTPLNEQPPLYGHFNQSYSGNYPLLTTAKVAGPEIKDDEVQYRFETTMGTKG